MFGRKYLCLVALGLVACGEADGGDSKGSDTELVEPTTPLGEQNVGPCGTLTSAEASALIAQHVQSLGTALIDRSLFINDSQLLHALLEEDASSPLVDQQDGHEGVSELVDELTQTVFAEGNLESSDETSLTYLLRPDVRCPDPVAEPDWDEFDMQYALEDQQECKDAVAQSQTRLEVSRALCDAQTDAVLISATVHDERLEVGQLLLHSEFAQSDLNLEHLFTATGEEDAETTVEASGTLTSRMDLEGTGKMRFSASSPAGFSYRFSSDTSMSGLEAGGAQHAELVIDSDARTMSGALALANWGIVEDFESWTWNYLRRDLVPESDSRLSPVLSTLPALSGEAEFDAGAETLSLEDVSLGETPFSMTMDGATLVAVELNPDAGHAVDAVFSLGDAGAINVSVPVASLLRMTYQLEPVAAQIEDVQEFVTNDLVTLSATDGSVASLLSDSEGQMKIGDESQVGPQLRMQSGSFSMQSQRFPEANLTVEPGMCLWQLASVERQHEMFGDMAAQSCE